MKKRFGRWEALEEGASRFNKDGREIKYYICKCQCGTVREVQLNSLKYGDSKSCGCLQKELASKHGESYSRLYKSYIDMRNRCTNRSNPNFPHYGGRGITYTPEWESYQVFRNWALANGYNDDLTLDRIDNDGNYNPSNCRWTTRGEQNRNMSSNVRIAWNGREMCLSEWARELGMNYNTLRARIQRLGWSIEDAFTKEVKC